MTTNSYKHPKAIRRTDKPHTFTGQFEGEVLVKWLNGERVEGRRGESYHRKQIAGLVADLNESARLYAEGGNRHVEAAERAERTFRRYPLTVTFNNPRRRGDYKTALEFDWSIGWRCPAGAYAARAIFFIVGLAERGLLGRIRQCGHCSRWFFAKFNHQRFCGKVCQLADYQTSDQWRERRRARYREARLRQKGTRHDL